MYTCIKDIYSAKHSSPSFFDPLAWVPVSQSFIPLLEFPNYLVTHQSPSHHSPFWCRKVVLCCIMDLRECKLEGSLYSFYLLSPKTIPHAGSCNTILGGRITRIVCLLWVRWTRSPGLIHFIMCSLCPENQTHRSLCLLKQ